MKVWVVNHPFAVRRWCQVRIREAGSRELRPGFVWAEWNDPPRFVDGPIVPRLPALAASPMSNVDPLVFGPRMYFDYCKKGRRSGNLRPPNLLEAGDLVLFACRRDNKIFLDTVFAIGDARTWPQLPDSLPGWERVGPLAERVHYHRFALEQHPEIHDPKVPARSYRGAHESDGSVRFSWVPWSSSPATAFELQPRTAAFKTLQAIYPGKDILKGFLGSFGVTTCEESRGTALFEQLIEQTTSQGFGVAAEVHLADDLEATSTFDRAEALACGKWKHCTEEEADQLLDGESPC
jgi:hypothetical protein